MRWSESMSVLVAVELCSSINKSGVHMQLYPTRRTTVHLAAAAELKFQEKTENKNDMRYMYRSIPAVLSLYDANLDQGGVEGAV